MYCDYCVCMSGWVVPNSYMETLYTMAKRALDKKKELQLCSNGRICFCEPHDKKKLVERVRAMKGFDYKKIHKGRAWSMAIVLGAIFVVGNVTSMAAGVAVNEWNEWDINQMENAEPEWEQPVYEEYEGSPEEFDLGELTKGLESQSASGGSAEVTLKNSSWQSVEFRASSGQSISVTAICQLFGLWKSGGTS